MYTQIKKKSKIETDSGKIIEIGEFGISLDNASLALANPHPHRIKQILNVEGATRAENRNGLPQVGFIFSTMLNAIFPPKRPEDLFTSRHSSENRLTLDFQICRNSSS